MKKITFLAILLISLSSIARAGQIRIVTTTTDLSSIATEIGGEKVSVTSLARGTQDHHYVEPRPSMVATLRNADLVVMIGMDHDIWVQALINSARNQNIRFGRPGYLDVSAGIEKLEVPFGKIDASMGHLHIYGNPHYWLDPLNAKIIAFNIASRLEAIAPEHGEYFRSNLEDFNRRIDQKMREWQSVMEPFRGEEIVVYHKSWPYFAERFGLVVAGELEPKPGIPPSPGHLRQVMELVRNRGIKVVVIEVFHNERAARSVAEQTGAEMVVLPSSVGGVPGTDDYFLLMDSIIYRLAEALGR